MESIDTEIQKILSAPDRYLRAAVKVICETNEDVRKSILALLEVVPPMDPLPQPSERMMKRKASDEQLPALNGKTNGLADSAPKRAKLVEEKVQHCIQCDQPFLESENAEGLCCYHPEDMEPDDSHDIFADMDEWHGDMDTEENRREFPDAFRFLCCEEDGTAKGCTYGRHLAGVDGDRKAPSPEDADVEKNGREDEVVETRKDDEHGDEE
ncbi:hypothetical protein QBC47DRAFT_31354 [Echria macrotheca]|uniref:Uncharacterized protein n=1 Tax=Echria macrotheca TaxID=438768 RepID=A0AAJ0FGY5_9PEZI|nr:hypothetical protein QBC47DRAFT_31354 [Echria macrotheca]